MRHSHIVANAHESMKAPQPVIIVHGGAGPAREEALTRAQLQVCREAALAGWQILRDGGAALDGVERAVRVLEDDPRFNAGTGAVLNAAGRVQLDASVMEGATLKAGAVAAVHQVRNPIALARKVLEQGRHVLLVAEGAEEFASAQGLEVCEEEALIVTRQRERWEREHGTVGCAARDAAGRLVAGTSSGGLFDALPGRVGDSALIGSGTYADAFAGISCTGHGEAIIRTVLAKSAAALVAAGYDASAAAQRAIALLADHTGSEAGLILVDRNGRIGHARNTERMVFAAVTGPQELCVGL
jgi:beta-aspartyl-peptidase (threonine type)